MNDNNKKATQKAKKKRVSFEDFHTFIPADYECRHDADVLYADPPWDILQKGSYGASSHYPVMKLEDIKAMPVKDLCKENAACFLWCTNGALIKGLEVLDAWGFTYRGYYIWGKNKFGLGQYIRNATEIMLIGTRGKMLPDVRNQGNWNLLPVQEHSKKPEELYPLIERMYKNRVYLELFARERPSNPNWLIWGLEAEGGSDIVIPGYPVPAYSSRVKIFDAPNDGNSALNNGSFVAEGAECDATDNEGKEA